MNAVSLPAISIDLSEFAKFIGTKITQEQNFTDLRSNSSSWTASTNCLDRLSSADKISVIKLLTPEPHSMKSLTSTPGNIARNFAFVIVLLELFAAPAFSQTRSAQDLYAEASSYSRTRTRELLAAGKRVTSDTARGLAEEQKAVAAKYAVEVAARPDLQGPDLYYLGLLYSTAEDDDKVLESMKRFLAAYPPDQKGEMIQYARGYVVAESARHKQLPDAEQYFALWLKGSPAIPEQQPILENALAAAYFKSGQYEPAVKHAQSAFDILKSLKPGSIAEKRERERTYMNLVEVLALSYKRSKNTEKALDVLAEARAQSFALPSANLYRKVMDFVEGGGFSEKKLMQKVESIPTADAAPLIKIDEWIGQEPATLDKFRGKVVLLDFWATWCGPCISTFPRLRGWHKKYAGNDFVMVGVTQYYGSQDGKKMSNLQELDFLKTFREKYKLPYAFGIVGAGEASKYGINAYPTTILLDRNGVVRYIGIGSGAEESSNLEDMIKEVLKEPAGPLAAR
jgi:thiol-disulfide isomerase/thioredoxin